MPKPPGIRGGQVGYGGEMDDLVVHEDTLAVGGELHVGGGLEFAGVGKGSQGWAGVQPGGGERVFGGKSGWTGLGAGGMVYRVIFLARGPKPLMTRSGGLNRKPMMTRVWF